ncbi:MAG: ATP-dependent DNA helicase RecG [Clostridia bacterium]|nr:ATP-dependent DNA helicase RecG [Clostridia bacterium]
MPKAITPDSEIQALKGVGPKQAEAFRRLGVRTVGDLLRLYPRGYEDRRKLCTIAELVPGVACRFVALVASTPTVARLANRRTVLQFRAVDETGSVRISYFNLPYLKNQIHVGQTYQFYGRVTKNNYGLSMISPEMEPLVGDEAPEGAILPVYPLTAGLSRKQVTSAMRTALDACGDNVPEILPPEVLVAHDLADAGSALAELHFPASDEALARARRKIMFEELFLLAAGLAMLKNRRAKLTGKHYRPFNDRPLRRLLPFSLTNAQERVIAEGLADLASGRLMNRLVQGDVGSGKTLVGAFLAYHVIQNGDQAAMMAPTEILAAQHYATLEKIFAPLGIRTVLLTGKMPAAARRAAAAEIASGEAQMIVGTHALISGGVEFSALGLVICDEQQRFGVAQRAALSAKGCDPHMLVMSATPIPRTLALILYGDLDLSIIDELPPGRQTIDTFLVGQPMRQRVEAFVRKQKAEGHQTYIVCPAIDESDMDELKSVTEYAESIAETVYPDLAVACLHGRMKSAEKDAIMADFVSGKTDVLVSTTVIEVGVDNPNATLMVIENAERFGLSQLHQLRGRVGRGKAKSYCILISAHTDAATKERLGILCKTNDGYEIARKDLELRGPGSFFGQAQSGLPSLRMASLATELPLLHEAQAAANELLAADPTLSASGHTALKAQVEQLFSTDQGNTFN